MKILLGITGSVGAQLTYKLLKKLISFGHEVKIIATDSALEFIQTDDYTKAIECDHQTDEAIEYQNSGRVLHVEYAQWADCFLLCPCTANTLNKWMLGICDNLVLSTLKAYEGPIYVAPVMNTIMLKKELNLIHDFNHSYNDNITVLWPTVKKLACGDIGLGAYPHLDDIVNIVGGHRWKVPKTFHSPYIFNFERESLDPMVDHPGWFGSKRKYDIHTGIDLYCKPDTDVYAFEDGEVVDIDWFTGTKADCPWWFDSKFMAIAGKSGTIIYGEIVPMDLKGCKVKAGQKIGRTVRIVKKPPKSYIIGHRMDMLHIELIQTGEAKWGGDWTHDEDRPKFLKDPTIYLYGLKPTNINN